MEYERVLRLAPTQRHLLLGRCPFLIRFRTHRPVVQLRFRVIAILNCVGFYLDVLFLQLIVPTMFNRVILHSIAVRFTLIDDRMPHRLPYMFGGRSSGCCHGILFLCS